MFMTFWAIVKNTFLETIRQPIYGVLLLVTAFLLIMNIFLAGFTLDDDNKLLLDLGLSTMLLSGLFLAAFSATGVLTREIENKTVLTIISKPVGRSLFLAGKYGGLIAAQCLAFYLSFLIFVLCMHHRVLQYSSDPFDWPAIIFGLGAVLLGLFIAGAANFFYGKEFASTSLALVTPLLTVGTIVAAMFDREFNPAPFAKAFAGGQLVICSGLLFMAIMIVAAVALAVSTRFGQVVTLMACLMVLIAGFISDWLLGQHQDKSAWAALLYRIVPNINFFWAADAMTADINIPLSYLFSTGAYACLWVAAALLVGVALFQRREVG
jgi:ABC-type transport system involved in multi-copper enzyme maturation permease subunit